MKINWTSLYMGVVLIAATGAATATEKVDVQCPANYPNKPVTWVVPWPPGGGADGLARNLQEAFSRQLRGQTIVIENKSGAGGNIGAAGVARAAPDGYTILLASASTHMINPSLYKSMPFKESDFAAITRIADVSNVLVVNPKLPVNSVQEFIEYSKTHTVDYASSGNGSIQHLAAELFKDMTGAPMMHVPYRGGGPATIATLSGETQAMFADPIAALPHVRAGRLRALATTGSTRSTGLPQVPTVAEAGVPGYNANSWIGLLAPAGTPEPIVQCLNSAMHAVLKEPELREKLSRMGYEPSGTTPQAFADLIRADISRWEKVVRKIGVTIQ